MRFLAFLILCNVLFLSPLYTQKSLNAVRTADKISIDGILDEAIWEEAEIASGFTTISPEYGKTPSQNTTVRVLYDDEALYISAVMEDVSRDSIMTELTQRDDLGNTDFFEVLIDTYGNGTDGIQFIVGATGVQYDALKENNGFEDLSWDVVWFSDVNLSENGWICELKIPYAAIRFPDRDEQQWLVNFTRRQARNNVHGVWNPIDPRVNGIFTQSGVLKNIKGIKPPVRLQFYPYLSAYTVNSNNKATATSISDQSINGGMDLKYGINDAFTLDMTLIPDFGQVESDDNVVNLSPFEVRFEEKRPFFTEGLDLFQRANIFYSRRIGGRPINYWRAYQDLAESEKVISNPQNARLLNATKISGRNSNGLGIGFFNAVEAATEATILNTETGESRQLKTQDLTNYNILVFDQNLKNNSYISLINTNVWRKGAEFYDANVTGLEYDIKDKKQNFSLVGDAAVAIQSFSNQDNNVGHKMSVSLGKISGNFNYSLAYNEISPDFNPNDLGFQAAGNERILRLNANYQIFEPFGNFNRANFWFNARYQRIIEPSAYRRFRVNYGGWVQTKNFWNFEVWSTVSAVSNDYFEPRVPGRHMEVPMFYNGGFWIGTDGRKKLRLSLSSYAYNLEEEGRWGYEWSFRPRYRVNNRLSFFIDTEYRMQYDDTGWVDNVGGEIIMGQRDRLTIENLLGAFYNFSENIGLNLRIRHYWDRGIYQSFHNLSPDGKLLDSDYDINKDYAGTFFNIDLNFNWRFAPGSDIFINWKNSISGIENLDINDINYFKSFDKFDSYIHNNSLSVRIVYFLDYQSLRKSIG